MDMEGIKAVRERLGYKLVAADVEANRMLKQAGTRRAFAEMVSLNGVNSLELFDRIQRCFEEHSQERPYHDWYHTCCVVEGTIQGLRYLLRHQPPDLAAINQVQINSAILAATFHDVGHSGVREPDVVNISRSIMIANRFLKENHLHDKREQPEAVDISFTLECLQSTQFPFPREPLNEFQAILRDADLMQVLEPTWFDDLYINMYQEFLEGNPELDFRQFCLNEMEFIKRAKFYSQWFLNEKYGEFLCTALSRVERAYSAVCR